MADITAAKSWTVSATTDSARRTTFDLGGNSITLGGETSPVEQLLAAIGACFTQSCLAVMQFQGLEPVNMTVMVRGHKAAGPVRGKGLGAIDIGVRFDQPVDKARRARLLKDTEAVCTVTNTLSRDAAIAVRDLTDDETP